LDKNDLFALTGRIFVATIFLASAFGKITNFQGTTEYMALHGMPMVDLLCLAAIAVEVMGGLSLVLGYYARWGAVALLVFMVPATLIFHLSPDQRIQLLKNMAIIGGLLQIAAFGPGEISLDYRSR
jgi:putative oxidoreductase